MPGIQVFERTGPIGFSEPVSNQQREIVMAVAKASVSDRRLVQLVDAQGDELDPRSGMMGLKEPGLFRERVLKIGVVAESDAQAAHFASAGACEVFREILLERSMTRLDLST